MMAVVGSRGTWEEIKREKGWNGTRGMKWGVRINLFVKIGRGRVGVDAGSEGDDEEREGREE